MSDPIKFTIHGQPPSKSNCYRVITFKPRQGSNKKPHSSLAKTKELKAYEDSFLLQIPGHFRGQQIHKPVRIDIDCYYNSLRPDLDNSAKAILDCMQNGRVIKNDNRVFELFMRKFIDKDDPRAEVTTRILGEFTPTNPNAEMISLLEKVMVHIHETHAVMPPIYVEIVDKIEILSA